MKLIPRYIMREIFSTFFAVLFVLISILLVQRLAFYLNQVLDGSLSQSAVFSLLGLQLVQFTTELLPLSFLLASILAFGRLYKDSEMTAIYALGVPVSLIYKILFFIGIPLSLTLVVLNFWIVPEIAKKQDTVLREARQDAQLTILKPGVFKEFARGKHIIYVQSISDNGSQLNNIFIKTNENDGTSSVTLAKTGHQIITPDNIRYILLNNGSRFHSSHEYLENIYFKTMKMQLDSDNSFTLPKAMAFSTPEVLTMMKTGYLNAEFHRRLASPISIFFLILLIPALSHAKPREGRFNKLIIGVIIYMIYFNLLGLGQAWIRKQDVVTLDIGLWWIHALMFIFAFYISKRHNRSL